MTSFPISLPTTPGVRKVKMDTDSAVAISESPFTYEQQTYKHQGQRWKATITLPVMRRPEAEAWIAVMTSLNGREGTFLMGDPDAKTPRGAATGSPLVNGGTQTGNTLVTDGWTHNIAGIMKAGDYIQLGSGSTTRMHKVLADANSDNSGNATLSIWPDLRGSPADNAAITVSGCKTVWRLDAPFGWDADEVSTFSVMFSATEKLP